MYLCRFIFIFQYLIDPTLSIKKSIRINSNKNISNDISMAIKNSKKFTKKKRRKDY